MNPPIKFCVSCGRHVSQADANRVGLKLGTGGHSRAAAEEEDKPQSRISKKSYSFHRTIRHFFMISSTGLMLALVYFFTMRFVLHQPLPFDKFYKEVQKQTNKTQPNKPSTPTKKYGKGTQKKKRKTAFGTATKDPTAAQQVE
jgi:hypothetical protein